MACRNGCGRRVDRSAENAVRGELKAAEQVAEEMPMCRHVNSIGRGLGCSEMERQLCRISCMLDEQSNLLAQLLQEVRSRG